MTSRSLLPRGAVACALLVFAAPAFSATLAFMGAQVIPIAGDPIPDGVLLVADGEIIAVGPRGSVDVPADAEVHDVSGKVIMPGLVDTHSHIGGGWAADGSAPIQPGVRTLDAIDVRNPGFNRARAGGITTLNALPGSGHLMSGQTTYLKLRKGNTIDDLLLRDETGWIMGGMKMANGTNPQRDPPFPGTRGKSAALVREQYIKAQEYRAKVQAAAKDKKKDPPARDLNMEALGEVLDGKRIVHHHTHRADDILTVLRLRDEFGFRVVLHHVSEGWMVADEIAKAGVPCSIILVDSPGGKQEALNVAFITGGVLEKAGVKVAFHTDDWITDSRLLLRSPALAVRAGMSREGALRAVTLSGAEMLDLGDRIGSLEPGKDADFIVLSGDPLSVYTQVLETWIEGTRVFDRGDPEDRLAAEGGWGAGSPFAAHIACFEGEVDR